MKRFMTVKPGIAAAVTLLFATLTPGAYAAKSKLHLEQVVADEASIYTVAVEIIGPTEIVVWDGQFHVADAKRMADQIAASGKHLKAIVVSHPDSDHYLGASILVERFPGTPVYMTATCLELFNKNAEKGFKNGKAKTPELYPDALVTPQVLPSNHLTVDGEDLEVYPDYQGDVLAKSNSFLWIPSLRTVLAGDLVFDGVHPYLGQSNEMTRIAWREACRKMASLHPVVVVAGHKKDNAISDKPELLNFMIRYMDDFDAMRVKATDAASLYDAMNKKYPDLAIPRFLQTSANSAFPTNK